MPSKSASLTSKRILARPIPLSTSDFLLIALAILCALVYAILMMELPVSIVFLIPLLVAWLIYWLKSHRLGSSAPLDLPILGLLIIASLGIVFAPFKDLFLPKLSGLIIGISVYSIIGAFFRYRQRLPWMIFFLVLLCFIVAVLGLFGTDWPIGNHALFDRIYARLPALVGKLGVEKINKNTIGGVLTFFSSAFVKFALGQRCLWKIEITLRKTFSLT